MGTYAVGESTSGVSIVSATYTGIDKLKIQLWDYYAHDILNVIYGQVDYSWNCLLTDSVKPFASAQFIKEDDIGDKQLKAIGGDGEIDSFYYGLKFGAKIENFTAYIAYSETTDNSEAGFDIIYKPSFVKNLNLRLRGNLADDFYVKNSDTDITKNGKVSWDEIRFIANYSF